MVDIDQIITAHERFGEHSNSFIAISELPHQSAIVRAECFEYEENRFFVDVVLHVNFTYRARLGITKLRSSNGTKTQTRIFKSSRALMNALNEHVDEFRFYKGKALDEKLKELVV